MTQFRISKVTALPPTLEANTVYVVSVGTDKAEIYVTATDASPRRLLNEADVNDIVNAAMASMASLEVVENIAARDALTLTANTQIIVIDASDDPTVEAGAATYAYRHSDTSFLKISESESLDVVSSWSTITGGPASSPTAIDSAVANAHSHANLTQLNSIDQDADGNFTYGGTNFVSVGDVGW